MHKKGVNLSSLAIGGRAPIERAQQTAHRAQTGFLYSYAFVMLIGIAVFITWFMIG